MYLLVNLEGNMANMAEIINELVNKFSVPISIVDSIDRACPNCKNGGNIKQDFGINSSLQIAKDPDLPPISPATTTEIIDVKPAQGLLDTLTDRYGVGRRTAAKQSAARALEKKTDSEIGDFSELQNLFEQAGCSRDIKVESPTNSYTPNTEEVNSPHGSAIDPEENTLEDFSSLEHMHPTLLACLISSTPNVFAQDGQTSPNGDTPPNLIAEGVFKGEEPSNQHNGRVLGQLISSSGKLRRGRIVYNSRDLDVLESFYSKDPNACADPQKKALMMEMLGVDAIRLKVWFQNRRRKDKIRQNMKD